MFFQPRGKVCGTMSKEPMKEDLSWIEKDHKERIGKFIGKVWKRTAEPSMI